MKYAHLTNLGGGAVTAAYEYDNNDDWKSSDHITAAFSFCNPNDQFCKSTGRNKAGGLLTQGKSVRKIPLDGNGIHTAIIDFLFEDFEGQSDILLGQLSGELDPKDFVDDEDFNTHLDEAVTTNRSCIAPFWLLRHFVEQYDSYIYPAVVDETTGSDCECTTCECGEKDESKKESPVRFY
jgi:hypothetical protein